MPGPWNFAWVAVLILFGMPPSFDPNQLSGQKPPDGRQIIHVDVEMVSLPVVVTTKEGRYVKGLRQEDFQVWEDGIRQEISGFAAAQEPVSVALLIDTSSSTEYELKRVQDETIRFVNALKPDDSVAIVSFADDVRVLEHFNIGRSKNTSGIRQIRPGGLSAVYEAVWLTLEQVLKPEYGRKAMVLFSDGVDNRSDSVSRDESLEVAKKTKATIFCIYFSTEKDRRKRIPGLIDPFSGIVGFHTRPSAPRSQRHPEYAAGFDYMKKLSEYSGGLFINATKNLDLGPAFQKIAQELAGQYSIGYYSTNPKHDGRFRKVEVRLNKSNLIARTKKGYFALSEP